MFSSEKNFSIQKMQIIVEKHAWQIKESDS